MDYNNAHRKCAKCGATASEDMSVKFHRFPKPGAGNNILRATAWATYCWPDHDWSLVKSLRSLHDKTKVLCGRHFQNSCYIDTNRTRLSRYAVPGTTEYVIKTLHSLRSKISAASIAQQINPSDNSLEAGSGTGPVSLQGSTETLPVPCTARSPTLPLESPLAACVTKLASLQGTASATAPLQIISATQLSALMADSPVACCSTDQARLQGLAETLPVAAAEPATMINSNLNKSKKRKGNGILKRLNRNKLSELSETEKKMYKIYRNKVHGIQRLKKKIGGKTKINHIEKICNDESVRRLFNLNLSHSFALLLESQLINCQRPKQGKRYNLDQKILALTLYKKSPSCYRLLTRIFSLPCPSTLNKLLNKVPMKPGINQQVFAGLRSMAETLEDDDKICTLVFDEMAIRKHVNYNTQLDCVDGFQDHGTNHGRNDIIACNTLVFMVCGLRKAWKQPVAFYFSGKSATADRLSVLIQEVLTECFRSGLNVVATICDMSSVNLKALRSLGSTAETPYFTHYGREIITIADPPHLLKCLRNMFMAHDIEIPVDVLADGNVTTGTAKWEHIKQFYESDNKNPHFVYAPALTEKHMNPNAKQKMRVKLAAQVFSHSVTAGILAKIATNELPAEAHATAFLLKKFDDLFDALNANSQDLRRGKKYSTNLTARSPHLEYLAEMKNIVTNMKFLNARNPPSQSGWVRTITAVERLWENLKKIGVKSLSTRRLNQDPIENFFGCVRYNCGSNYNPTTSQFIAGFKTAIITNMKNSSNNKNCEDDCAILSNNMKSFLTTPDAQNINIYEYDITDDEQTEVHPDNTSDEIEALSSEAQACAYVCGFLIKKMDNSCNTCNALLTSNPGSETVHIFTELKEYSQTKTSLNYASLNLVKAVERVAGCCKSFLGENLHSDKIRELTVMILQTECKPWFDFLKVCPQHYKTNIDDILHHVFIITMKRHIILKNRELSVEANKNALKRKLSILKNK